MQSFRTFRPTVLEDRSRFFPTLEPAHPLGPVVLKRLVQHLFPDDPVRGWAVALGLLGKPAQVQSVYRIHSLHRFVFEPYHLSSPPLWTAHPASSRRRADPRSSRKSSQPSAWS